MPDILIRGLEMPREDDLLCLNIHPNGDVTINLDLKCIPIARAVELPPHGDLIDRAALMEEHAKAESAKYGNHFVAGDNRFIHRFLDAPVIVPSEKGETQ